MTSVLLTYLHQWCLNNSFSKKGVSTLVEVYRALGCFTNCWFLSRRYLLEASAEMADNRISTNMLGLDIGIIIDEVPVRFRVHRTEEMWAERDSILREIRNSPARLSLWFELVEKYVELEELLMAVWTLFVIRANMPPATVIETSFSDQLGLIKVYGTSGCFWNIVAEDAFISKVVEILSGDKTREEIVDLIGGMCASSFGFSVTPIDLLQPFKWPECIKMASF